MTKDLMDPPSHTLDLVRDHIDTAVPFLASLLAQDNDLLARFRALVKEPEAHTPDATQAASAQAEDYCKQIVQLTKEYGQTDAEVDYDEYDSYGYY